MPYAISICVAANPILFLYPRVKKSGENGTRITWKKSDLSYDVERRMKM